MQSAFAGVFSVRYFVSFLKFTTELTTVAMVTGSDPGEPRVQVLRRM